MLNLEQLEDDRAEAQYEKAELFDFYHKHWDTVIEEIKSLRRQLQEIDDLKYDLPA